jgi:Xaa-Pro dipeptidase
MNRPAAKCVFLSTSETRPDENFYYATGIPRDLNLNSFAIVRRGRKPLVVASALEYDELKKHGTLDVVKYESRKDIEKIMRTLPARVGVNYSCMTVAGMKRLKKYVRSTYDVSKMLGEARSVKTAGEIRKIKQACKISEDVLNGVPDMLRRNMAERELALEMEYRARKEGADGLAFPTIVAYGPNAAVPHHSTGPAKIGRNNFLLVDFGVVTDGYCADLSRTFFIGRAGDAEKKAYRTVKAAQQAAMAAVRPGVKYAKLLSVANEILEKGLGQKLIHGLGHGLGINVHDYPAGKNYVLRNGSVITVEPGYYRAGAFGLRIEDDIAVRGKARMLSRSPKNLVEL